MSSGAAHLITEGCFSGADDASQASKSDAKLEVQPQEFKAV